MRRLLRVAPFLLLATAWAVPCLYGQHGGGHGGSSRHSTASSHAGFSSSANAFRGVPSGPSYPSHSPGTVGVPSRSSRALPAYNYRVPVATGLKGEPRYTGRPSSAAPNRASGAQQTNRRDPYDRSGFVNGTRRRMPYSRNRRYDRGDSFYGGAVWPWWLSSYGYLGYPNFYQYPPWWDFEDSSDLQAYATQGPMQQDYSAQLPPEEPTDPASLPPWPSINAPENTESAPEPVPTPLQPRQEVTLVFNDGRPPEKVYNFLLTAGTLYVMDQQRQEIPVAELDLAATARVNRQAGVEFKVPDVSK